MSTLAALALAPALITAVMGEPAVPEALLGTATTTQTTGYEKRLVVHMDGITWEEVDKDGNYVKRIPDTSGLTEDKPLEVCVPETAAAFALAGGSLYWVKKRALG